MVRLKLFILQFIILLFVLPVYASDVNHETRNEQLVVSSLPEEAINNGPKTVSDYSQNELAAAAVKRNITLFTEKIRE